MSEKIKLALLLTRAIFIIILLLCSIYNFIMFFQHVDKFDKIISLIFAESILLYLVISRVADKVDEIKDILDRFPKITVLSNNFDAPKNNSIS